MDAMVAPRWLSLLLLTTLAGCSLPSLGGRSESRALPLTEARATTWGRTIEVAAQQHPGLTGLYALEDAQEAFAARVQLAQHAERTLDVQYYIWRNDITGHLLLEALQAAADRGVRVRLLLDDNGIPPSMDEELVVLDTDPLIEVRLFNPFVFRPFKPLGFVTDFSRANRRMHNKSFTADNTLTILGGRNIGDEYFGATDGVLFADLDVLAMGPVVAEISNSFDAYWASGSSYPIASLVEPPSPEVLAHIDERLAVVERSELAALYEQAVRELPSYDAMIRGDLQLIWAPAHLLVDDPAKGLALAAPEQLLITHMREAIGTPLRSMDLVSPYFVPTNSGTDYFVDLARRGVKVRILTNSLAATDVLAVHSGYARHRPRLLEAGVALYERKAEPGTRAERKDDGVRMPGGSGGGSFSVGGSFGSSGSSLHAKTFGVDGERIFVGSFNFDPRSERLNTELGIIVDSPELTAAMTQVLDTRVPLTSWQLQLAAPGSGTLQWFDASGTPPQTFAVEPATTWWERTCVHLLDLLPIDWLL